VWAAGEREGENRQGDAPKVSMVTHKIQVKKKSAEADPSSRGKILIT